MYQLYYAPGACSMSVHVLFNELNQPVELHRVLLSEGQQQTPEFLKLNPRGQVPLLVEDGTPIAEGAAQIIYLADKFQSPLLPRDGLARAKALEWLMFANATLHPAYARVFFLHKNLGEGAEQNPLYAPAIAAVQKLWDLVEAQLANQPYLCGQDITVADILVTVMANWGGWLKQPVAQGPKTKALLARVIARPSYQKALATEQVEYKAAA